MSRLRKYSEVQSLKKLTETGRQATTQTKRNASLQKKQGMGSQRLPKIK